MKKSHLATAAFWIGLLTLCAQGAAQIPAPPRPPLPIPNVVALMPPTAPLLPTRPTPIPPPAPAAIPIPPERPAPITPAMMPISPRIALPPVEYDRPYTGKLTVLKEDNYVFIQHVCADTPNAIACSFRTYDSVTGETLSCLIMLGPDVWDDERALRHERAHCHGWPGSHPNARYGD